MSLMLPHPTRAILVFGSTRQSLSDQVSITLADRFHHIGGTVIEFHDQPLGRSSASRHHARNIHHALAECRHRRFDLTWPILDVQERRARTKATDHPRGILSGRLHPIYIDFEKYVGVKVFE